MHDQWEEIWYQLAEMRRQAGNTDRFGTVKEVKGDKIRVVYGIKNDGKELLSPWLHTADQRGGNRERHQYEKGQNVRVSSTAGTFRNGSVGHYAASKSFPAPPQADQVNGHSGICGKFAFSYNKQGSQQESGQGSGGGGGGGGSSGGGGDDFGEFQINGQAEQNPQHQDQTGEMGQFGGQQQPQQGGQQQQAPQAEMKTRMSDSGFITHRVGKNVRVAVSDKEAMVMWGESGENTVFCDDEGCHSTKPLTIKKPKSKLDNA